MITCSSFGGVCAGPCRRGHAGACHGLKWGASQEAWGLRAAFCSCTSFSKAALSHSVMEFVPTEFLPAQNPCMSFINISLSSGSKFPDAQRPVQPSPLLGWQSVPRPWWLWAGGDSHAHPHLAPGLDGCFCLGSSRASLGDWDCGEFGRSCWGALGGR